MKQDSIISDNVIVDSINNHSVLPAAPSRTQSVFKKIAHKTDGILTGVDYKKNSKKIVYIVMLFFLVVAVVITLFPPLWLLVSSFKGVKEISAPTYHFWPENFRLYKVIEVWKMLSFTKYFINTLLVVAGATIAAVLLNGLLGYALSILKPAGSKVIFAIIMAGYMIPVITGMVPIYSAIVDLKLNQLPHPLNYLPLWLSFGANAYYLVLFKGYFDSIPSAIFEASKVDGASKMRIFFKMLLPLSKPIIGVVCIFAATGAWSDFLLPYLLLKKDDSFTIMVKIYTIQNNMAALQIGLDTLLMVLTISTLPLIILFLVFQRQITSTVTTSGIK